MPIIFILISCVSQKLKKKSQARDLYISDWFSKAKTYADILGDQWMILSAKHGLLEPETMIEPYERSLYECKREERKIWAKKVAGEIESKIPFGSTIIILAGNIYREFLIPLLEENYSIEIPMKGLKIGQQKSFLKEKIKDVENQP